MEMGRGSPQEQQQQQQQQQQLTIFYDGRVCVCEVTELQVCTYGSGSGSCLPGAIHEPCRSSLLVGCRTIWIYV